MLICNIYCDRITFYISFKMSSFVIQPRNQEDLIKRVFFCARNTFLQSRDILNKTLTLHYIALCKFYDSIVNNHLYFSVNRLAWN